MKTYTENLDLFDILAGNLERASDHYIERALDAGEEQAQAYGYDTSRRPRVLSVTVSKHNSKIVDLKPAFQHGPKVRYTSAGNWYTIVPIKRSPKSLGNGLLEQAQKIQVDYRGMGTNFIKDLYSSSSNVDGSPLSVIARANRTGGNLTKVISNKTNTENYYAFRTVSAKSPINSWIVGINNARQDDRTNRYINNIRDVIIDSLRGG